MIHRTASYILLLLFAVVSIAAKAYDPDDHKILAGETPKELQNVGITEKLGDTIDLDLMFTDQTGQVVPLRKFVSGDKPVLFSIIYFSCPSLCNYHLNGLTAGLKNMEWTVGDQFDVVALSMDPREGPELAAAKMQSYIDEYGRPESAKGWHFLTGPEENIKKIAAQVGFGYKWNEQQQEYAHASAAQVLTPSGKISRYLHGIEFKPQTIKLALLEASNGKIGTIVDQFVLYCFQFNPNKSEYTIYSFRLMQMAGLAMVLVLAIFLIPFWIRERKRLV